MESKPVTEKRTVNTYTHTKPLSPGETEKLKTVLTEKNFIFSPKPYTVINAKNEGVSVSVYSSGKIVVQGRKTADFVEFILEPLVIKELSFSASFFADNDMAKRIGSDESGKGDFFGPLVVSGVCAYGEEIAEMAKAGVRDSKKIKSEAKIHALEKIIAKNSATETVSISPKRFNQMYMSMKNMNKILAWAHACVIENLIKQTGCKLVVVDKFAPKTTLLQMLKEHGRKARIIQRTKAESDIVVAAASICARAAYLKEMKRLGDKYGVTFPKGGGSDKITDALKTFLSKYGKNELENVAKINFKTSDGFL
ncbi:ribonuclease HIII [bacterium]|nr:ribonuclease HIII [bacterium]